MSELCKVFLGIIICGVFTLWVGSAMNVFIFETNGRKYNKSIDQSIANMVEEVMPSVVHIQYRESEYGRSWQGSGAIISEDGLILTARHVVENPGVFTITLSDGRKFVTDKACVSKEYDVGYLKVDVNDPLPAAKFGDSSTMRLGSRLLAIGSPFGKQHFNSVTLGILSGIDRSYTSSGWGWSVLFQTDATANPGNSGCPVFTMEGRIVGIVVGAPTRVYAGIVYCVPSNVCKSIIENARLAFVLQEVIIVEADERIDALEDSMREVEEDVNDIERRLDDVEDELNESNESNELEYYETFS